MKTLQLQNWIKKINQNFMKTAFLKPNKNFVYVNIISKLNLNFIQKIILKLNKIQKIEMILKIKSFEILFQI